MEDSGYRHRGFHRGDGKMSSVFHDDPIDIIAISIVSLAFRTCVPLVCKCTCGDLIALRTPPLSLQVGYVVTCSKRRSDFSHVMDNAAEGGFRITIILSRRVG